MTLLNTMMKSHWLSICHNAIRFCNDWITLLLISEVCPFEYFAVLVRLFSCEIFIYFVIFLYSFILCSLLEWCFLLTPVRTWIQLLRESSQNECCNGLLFCDWLNLAILVLFYCYIYASDLVTMPSAFSNKSLILILSRRKQLHYKKSESDLITRISTRFGLISSLTFTRIHRENTQI
jgi:hypothetical protein